jgi:hypothetical protein
MPKGAFPDAFDRNLADRDAKLAPQHRDGRAPFKRIGG